MYVHKENKTMTRTDIIKLIAQNKCSDLESQAVYELILSKKTDSYLIDCLSFYGHKVEKYCSEFIFKF